MSHKDEEKIQITDEDKSAYVPLFIREQQDGVMFFTTLSSFRLKSDKSCFFINPHGYAYAEQDEFDSLMEVLRNEGEYLLYGQNFDPDVVDECPKGWLTVQVIIKPAHEYPEDSDESLTKTKIEEMWNHQSIDQVVEGLMCMIESLLRVGKLRITEISKINLMKNYAMQRIQSEKDFTEFEPLFMYLHDSIADQKDAIQSDGDIIKYPDDVMALLEKFQRVSDQKFSKLTDDSLVKQNILDTLDGLSLEDMKDVIGNYKLPDLEKYFEQLTKSDHFRDEDIDKATFIREHIEKKKEKL